MKTFDKTSEAMPSSYLAGVTKGDTFNINICNKRTYVFWLNLFVHVRACCYRLSSCSSRFCPRSPCVGCLTKWQYSTRLIDRT